MNLHLFNGSFPKDEALDLLTQMVYVKIKYYERKIDKTRNEEEIKLGELRIKQLQKEFYEVKKIILMKSTKCDLEAEIKIS